MFMQQYSFKTCSIQSSVCIRYNICPIICIKASIDMVGCS
uniref:Uncharacterized protein n=1 Tax=Arundo donax TaxID=35708 RepID=A0A0A9B8G5_ARUDO